MKAKSQKRDLILFRNSGSNKNIQELDIEY
jgi:hypothetical protein